MIKHLYNLHNHIGCLIDRKIDFLPYNNRQLFDLIIARGGVESHGRCINYVLNYCYFFLFNFKITYFDFFY